ncbi:MAG: DUF4912 domain-containing protein [Leptolyngbyaceae cyanobacterium SL_7_1]|nr:DUF4912 domain-containing protein [Leptolyngbyaceae cyanobacterium SL_7_1]
MDAGCPWRDQNRIRLPIDSFTPASVAVPPPGVDEVAVSVSPETPTVIEPELPTPSFDLPDLGAAALAAGVGAAAIPLLLNLKDNRSRITLEPREGQQGYAHWHAPEEHKADARAQGGRQFGLRLADVTGIDATVETPASVQFFELDESAKDLSVPIADRDRDYLAEIGYTGEQGQWLAMAQSNTIRFDTAAQPDLAIEPSADALAAPIPPVLEEPELPSVSQSQPPVLEPIIPPRIEQDPPVLNAIEPPLAEPAAPMAMGVDAADFDRPGAESPTVGMEGVAMAGALGMAGLPFLLALRDDRSRITLEPAAGQQGYAHWHAPAEHKAEVRHQGGRQFGLRLYDVTGIDPTIDSPYSVQFFELDEAAEDLSVPIADRDRDYLAEIGYNNENGQWLPMARSNPIRLPLVDAAAFPPTGTMDRATLAMETIASTFIPAEEVQSEVEATKFDVGQTDLSAEALAAVDEFLPDLPDGYGESRIILMPRDPQWAYTYWDVPNDHREALRQQGGTRLALRFYDVTDLDFNHQSPHSLQQYDCEEMARDWYLPVPVSDRDYIAEIGYLTEDGRWLLLARSNPAHFPPVYPSDWFEDQFVSIGWDESLRGRTVLGLVPPGKRQSFDNAIYDRIFGMAQSTEAMRIAGSLFGSMQHMFGSMQQVPESVISSFVTPSGMGMWTVPMASGIGMSGIGMSGIGMAASMPPIRARKFWLVADAELIVYGATEPDATVTIAGRPVPLNPDGTFRFQLSFQDGFLSYPIVAVAADGEQTRSIHLEFERQTPERHTNTKDEAVDEWFS